MELLSNLFSDTKLNEKNDSSRFCLKHILGCKIPPKYLIAEAAHEYIDDTGISTINTGSLNQVTLINSVHPCHYKNNVGSVLPRKSVIFQSNNNNDNDNNEIEVSSTKSIVNLILPISTNLFEEIDSPKNFYIYCDTQNNPEILNAFLTLIAGKWIELDEKESFPNVGIEKVWTRRDNSNAYGSDHYINKLPHPFKQRFISLPVSTINKQIRQQKKTISFSINLGPEINANQVAKLLTKKLKINYVLIWNMIVRQVNLISEDSFISLMSHKNTLPIKPIILEVRDKTTGLFYHDIDWNINIDPSRLYSIEMNYNEFNLKFFNHSVNYKDIEVFYLLPVDWDFSHDDLNIIDQLITINDSPFKIKDYAPFSSSNMEKTKRIRTTFSWLMFDSDLSHKSLMSKKDFANYIIEIIPHPLKEIVCFCSEEKDFLYGISFSTLLLPDKNNMASPFTIISLPCTNKENLNYYKQYVIWLEKRLEEKSIVGTTIKLKLIHNENN